MGFSLKILNSPRRQIRLKVQGNFTEMTIGFWFPLPPRKRNKRMKGPLQPLKKKSIYIVYILRIYTHIYQKKKNSPIPPPPKKCFFDVDFLNFAEVSKVFLLVSTHPHIHAYIHAREDQVNLKIK